MYGRTIFCDPPFMYHIFHCESGGFNHDDRDVLCSSQIAIRLLH
ncbi:hypothetical protein Plhal304r1_c067g0155461 [Plasmopara halstedii]